MKKNRDFSAKFEGHDRYGFPDEMERVTAGKGSDAIVVFGSDKAALVDCGMAYCGEAMMRNLKKAIAKRNKSDGSPYTLRTIEHIEQTMIGDPYIVPIWVCLPLNLRNAVSVFQPHWCCWDPEEKKHWVRPMPQFDGVLSDPSVLPFWRHRMEFEEFIVKFPGPGTGGARRGGRAERRRNTGADRRTGGSPPRLLKENS